MNRVLPSFAEGYAHELYAALRAMDLADAEIILVETPPQIGPWQGINDRLRRATFDSVNVLDGLI